MRCYIGFDLGGSSMKTGIVTENAEVLAHQNTRSRTVLRRFWTFWNS